MIYALSKACAFWLCRFLYIQSFLSLVSLPILIAWGLPFSYGTVLGNLIFSPIIIVFLFLSSLMFFCHLVSVPFGWGIWVLEKLNALWNWGLSFSSGTWLAYFICPPKLLLLLIPCSSYGLLLYLKRYPLWMRSGIMTSVLIITCGILRLSSSLLSPEVAVLACPYGDITFIVKDQKIMMIDSGGMGSLKGNTAWVEYTCVPYIAKTFGTMYIDDLVVLKATATTLKTIVALHTLVPVKNLYIPRSIIELNKDLGDTLASLSMHMIFLDHDNVVCGQDQSAPNSTIAPLNKHGITRYIVTINKGIDKETITIYPSGYTKRNKYVYN